MTPNQYEPRQTEGSAQDRSSWGLDHVETTREAIRVSDERAERAARLASLESEKATKLAIERALIDQKVTQNLKEHEERLNGINGSIRASVDGLSRVEKNQDEIKNAMSTAKAVTEALALQLTQWNTDQKEAHTEQVNTQATSRQLKVAVISVIFAFLGIVIALALGLK